MYGILVLCLLLRPVAFSSGSNTTHVQPAEGSDERQARDGDYIGCYPQGCFDVEYHAILEEPTTPDTCTATCKENGFIIAALYNRTECACSCEQTCLTQQMDDTQCGLPCKNYSGRFCGGFAEASYYAVKSVNTSKSKCSEKLTGGTDGSSGTETLLKSRHIPVYIAAGIFSAFIIFLIIIFACLRKCDRRVVYSPRNHSRRWRAHASSQENEERPPNDPQTTSDQPRLPTRNMSGAHPSSSIESTSHTQSRRNEDHPIVEDIRGNLPVMESNFYHVLTKEDDEETCSQGLSLATENAYAYADCRAYMDSFPRKAACMHSQADTPRCPENNEEVEHEMVNNELYALSNK